MTGVSGGGRESPHGTGVPAVTEYVCDCRCAFAVKNILHRELVKGTPIQAWLEKLFRDFWNCKKGITEKYRFIKEKAMET